MDIEKPAFIVSEIEKMRLKLDDTISKCGFEHPLTLKISEYLDKIIVEEIKRIK